MHLPTEDFHIFVDLGLTIVQSKVLFCLAERGFLKAKEISCFSKVSRPDVYRALKELQEAGLIEQEMSIPYRFRAIPSEIAFDILITRRDTKTKELQVKTSAFIKKFKNNISNHINAESGFVLFPSKESLMIKLAKTIQNTNKTIDVLTSHSRFTYGCYCLSEFLNDAWKRGVIGRGLIYKNEKNIEEPTLKIWEYPSAEIRYILKIPSSVVSIYDKKEACIFTKPEVGFKDSPMLWSDNPSLVNIASQYFECEWAQSEAFCFRCNR